MESESHDTWHLSVCLHVRLMSGGFLCVLQLPPTFQRHTFKALGELDTLINLRCKSLQISPVMSFIFLGANCCDFLPKNVHTAL